MLLFSTDVQQLLVVKEEVPSEQQVWISSLDQVHPEPPLVKEEQEDQENPEPPHIKEEQEELWTSREGEQLQGLEEAGLKFSFTPVKIEADEEEARYSRVHQRQTEQMEIEADGDDCGGPEPDRNPDPDRPPDPDEKTGDSSEPDPDEETGDCSEPDIDDSVDWKKTREPQSGLNSSHRYLVLKSLQSPHQYLVLKSLQSFHQDLECISAPPEPESSPAGAVALDGGAARASEDMMQATLPAAVPRSVSFSPDLCTPQVVSFNSGKLFIRQIFAQENEAHGWMDR
ncbi:hypothetical protein EYF80_051016 [Liparis tanakae]|uniref:Uncharacterized protein n=1 Tax=Liparis tanakae TaxID=230148 RepID=A0A4Z2FC88_9TELE|nr:hypothetical protein EYF80_051016 [Liparis tanakae]